MKKLLTLTLACALVSAPALKAENEDPKKLGKQLWELIVREKRRKIKDMATGAVFFGALGLMSRSAWTFVGLQGLNLLIHHDTVGELIAEKLYPKN